MEKRCACIGQHFSGMDTASVFRTINARLAKPSGRIRTRVMATDPADIFFENRFSTIVKMMDSSPDSEVMGNCVGYVGAPEWNPP
jgi:hypothetical protein